MLDLLQLNGWLTFLYGILYGCIIASFFCCVQMRWQKGLSLWTFSTCDHCQKKLSLWQMIPIFSYLLAYIFLKARCFHCQKKIRREYFFSELLSGLIGGFIFMTSLPELRYWSLLDAIDKTVIIAVLIWITTEDFFTYTISLISLFIFFGLSFIILLGMFDYSLTDFFGARWLSFSMVSGLFLILYFLFRHKLGLGDVICIAIISLWLDFFGIWVVLLITSTLGLIYGLLSFLSSGESLSYTKIKIPFIPFLSLSFAIALWDYSWLMNFFTTIYSVIGGFGA